MDTPKRYHPSLVTLHWLIALLVFVNLYLGLFILKPRGGGGFDFAARNTIQVVHMTIGISILLLLVVRLITRFVSKKPNPATAGSAILDFIARAVHYALYFFLFVMTLSGLIFSLQSNRFQSAFLGASESPRFNGPPPGFAPPNGTPGAPGSDGNPNFSGNPGRQGNNPGFGEGFRGPFFSPLQLVHATTATILLLILGLQHILAAFYHQFIRRDRLFARMWFGAR